MAARKSERLMNLTIALVQARGFLTRHQIRKRVGGYESMTNTAFERAFERDKDELRRFGLQISVGHNAETASDEVGYRILRSEFELPPVQLTAEEAAVVGVATRAWPQADLARSTATAAQKLSLDSEAGSARLPWDPVFTVPEAIFSVFVDAVHTRTRVRFDYRNAHGDIARRTLEPWGLSQTRGAWYVTGRDVDRDARRTFKLDRVLGEPAQSGAAHRFVPPADLDLTAIWRELADQPVQSAVLAFRPGAAAALQRYGRPTDHPRPEGLPPDWVLLQVDYNYQPGFAGEVAAAAGNVMVLDPPDLRERVLELWAGVAS